MATRLAAARTAVREAAPTQNVESATARTSPTRRTFDNAERAIGDLHLAILSEQLSLGQNEPSSAGSSSSMRAVLTQQSSDARAGGTRGDGLPLEAQAPQGYSCIADRNAIGRRLPGLDPVLILGDLPEVDTLSRGAIDQFGDGLPPRATTASASTPSASASHSTRAPRSGNCWSLRTSD